MWTVVFARRSPTTSSGDHLSNSCARSERKRPVTHSSTLTTPGLIAQISHLRMLARTDTVRLELGIDEHIGHLPSPRDREPAPAVWTHRTSARASAPHPPANTPAPHGPPPPDRSRQGPPASRNTTAVHGAPGPDEGSELHRPEPDGTRVSTQPGTALGALLQHLKAPDRLPAAGYPRQRAPRRPCGRRAGSDASVSHDAPASRQARSTAAPGARSLRQPLCPTRTLPLPFADASCEGHRGLDRAQGRSPHGERAARPADASGGAARTGDCDVAAALGY